MSSQPPLTQYEAWKAKQKKTKRQLKKEDEEGAGDREEEDQTPASESAPRPSQGQPQSGGGRAPKVKAGRVPIKVERAKATRQADIDSGVAGALRLVAAKKKQKELKKKAKKATTSAFAVLGEEEEEEEEEDDHHSDNESSSAEEEEESEDEDANQADTATSTTHPKASIAAIKQKGKGSKPKHAPPSESESEVDEGEGEEEEEKDQVDEAESFEDRMFAYRETNSINVLSLDEFVVSSSDLSTDPMYFPITSFDSLASEFGLSSTLVHAATGNFQQPTPIQSQTWPILLGGKDVIGVAMTGSGKSMAFLLPAIFYITQVREREARKAATTGVPIQTTPGATLTPRVLVLAPTRELAIQIHKVAADIATALMTESNDTAPTAADTPASSSSSSSSTPSSIRCYVLFGGTSIETQLSSLRSLTHLDLLVSTPGRLLKHLTANSISLSRVGYFVLDEADRMLDLGFEASLRTISDAIPPNRQTCLFSATWESIAERGSKEFLKRGPAKGIKVVIGSEELTAAKSVQQVVEVIDRRQGKRERRLLQLLQDYIPDRTHPNRILIFVLYKKETTLLADHLQRHGWSAVAISGDRTQAQRMEALERFRSGVTPILVATDVAARGIDIKGVTHVINFSLGLSVEQYIHRIGRCGRAGSTGLAHTFIVDYDAPNTPGLVKVLRESEVAIEPELEEMAERAERQAAKHANQPDANLKGDAYFASLKAGALTKNVNLAKQLAKEAEDAEIEAKIFGEDTDGPYVGGKGKKMHSAQQKRNQTQPGKKGKGGGGKRR